MRIKWCTFVIVGAVIAHLSQSATIRQPNDDMPIRLTANDLRNLQKLSGRSLSKDATSGKLGTVNEGGERRNQQTGSLQDGNGVIVFGDIPEEIPTLPEWTTASKTTTTEEQTTTQPATTTTQKQTTSTTESVTTTTEKATTEQPTTTIQQTTTVGVTTTQEPPTTTNSPPSTEQQTTTVKMTTQQPTTTQVTNQPTTTEKKTTSTGQPTTDAPTTKSPTTTESATTTTQPTTTTTMYATTTTQGRTTTTTLKPRPTVRPTIIFPPFGGGDSSSESDDGDDWWSGIWGWGDDDYDFDYNYNLGDYDDDFFYGGFDDRSSPLFSFSGQSVADPQRKVDPSAVKKNAERSARKLAGMIDEKLENMHKNAREWLYMFSDSKLHTDMKAVKRLAQLNRFLDGAYKKVVKKFLQFSKNENMV